MLRLLPSITNTQGTFLRKYSCYTDIMDEKLRKMHPKNQLHTEKSGGHCNYEVMLSKIATEQPIWFVYDT